MYVSTGGLGRWGTICDDNWDIQDATVVCHELGYPYVVGAPRNAHYGEGTGPILLDNVVCLGNESEIFACMHNGIGNHDCFHREDASVECLCMLILMLCLHAYMNCFNLINLLHLWYYKFMQYKCS